MGVTRPSARVDNTRFAARRTPVSLRPRTSLLLSSVLPALACGAAPAQTAGDAGTSGSDASTTAVADDSTGESGASAPTPVGRCEYVSPFTQGAECREYLGDGWTEADVSGACDQLSGTATLGAGCGRDGSLGECVLDAGGDQVTRIVVYGDDPGTCADQKTGCEVFGGGAWEPAAICDDGGDSGEPPPPGSVFEQPTRSCVEPLAGEPPGLSEGGQVCTWWMISGATEPGRRFVDYGSCDTVLTQRPYYPAPPAAGFDAVDPRLDDPAYVDEVAWVRGEIEASACVCCHSDVSPQGASIWTIDAPDNWVNSFSPTGLAFAGGIIDSTAFGAYPPEQNNGFHRDTTGLPTTDPARLRAFFVDELAHRGLTPADFADAPPVGGPLVDQLEYVPGPCTAGEGVAADGTVTWTGGDARYVYVLEADARSPTVPPNLDIPDGTLWRIDVPSDGQPLRSTEVQYGITPAGTTRRVPEDGAPASLVAGRSYYLYAARDVLQPVTRCVFTF